MIRLWIIKLRGSGICWHFLPENAVDTQNIIHQVLVKIFDTSQVTTIGNYHMALHTSFGTVSFQYYNSQNDVVSLYDASLK